jgi:hydroxypyruvate reductase/glycerate 2-kinase
MSTERLRADVRAIWDACIAAVQPEQLVRMAFAQDKTLFDAVSASNEVFVVGGGKAGAGMAAGLESALAGSLDRVSGLVNVPAGSERALQRVHAIPVREAGNNAPTPAAVARTGEMLKLVAAATADDVVICLLSGGGSALLPAPTEGITLEDKQTVTRLLHECGASIGEMNAVRKHLSRVKGGGLVRASKAGHLFALIISDVIGDPLDVIASGPTSPDPTTFADALQIVKRCQIIDRLPPAVRSRLERGAAGELPETLKELPPKVQNVIVGDNATALAAAEAKAKALGYPVINLGPNIDGETRDVAEAVTALARDTPAPQCILLGGETTVTLPPEHGKGGRNTEFVLSALVAAAKFQLSNFVVLSGGTDGEDGPTDAAGAVGDPGSLARGRSAGLDPADFLGRHDSYNFFEVTGDLLKTGLTGTNVMDIRIVIRAGP